MLKFFIDKEGESERGKKKNRLNVLIYIEVIVYVYCSVDKV